MQKIILLIIISLICIVLTAGCINQSNETSHDHTEVVPLCILISNKDIVKYNITLRITDEHNNTIYQKHLSLLANEKRDIKNITIDKGKYFVSVELNDNRSKTYPVHVGKYAYYVYVNLYRDKIEIIQTVE